MLSIKKAYGGTNYYEITNRIITLALTLLNITPIISNCKYKQQQ